MWAFRLALFSQLVGKSNIFMIIDFHTHIFPDNICENREAYFSSEPAFKFLYSSPDSKLVTADRLVEVMDEQGVDVSVAVGFPWQSMETIKMHNDYIIDAIQKYPDRIKGFCCIDPFNNGSVFEAERSLEAGLSGIGELAFYFFGIDSATRKALEPYMEICRKRDIPIMIHTNEPVGHIYPGKTPNTLRQIYKLVTKHPRNRIVLSHWGGGIFFYTLLKKEVKEALENVYFDTAASPFLYDPEIYRAGMSLAGKEKILFGTDFPLIEPARYFKELELSGLSEKDIELVCGGNAKRLLFRN